MKSLNKSLSFGSSYIRYVEILKTEKSNLIRISSDIANCHHDTKCEIFSTVSNSWNLLFTKYEVSYYDSFDYVRCSLNNGKTINPEFNRNIDRVKKHFEKVYSELI